MDSQEQEIGKIKYLIDKLRSITLTVQIAPFIYTLFYIIILFIYPVYPENILNVLDTLFYVSPLIVLLTLIESKVLRLCRYHKLACLLPLLPQATVFVDYHLIELTGIEVQIHYATVFIMAVLLLISAYNVFIK